MKALLLLFFCLSCGTETGNPEEPTRRSASGNITKVMSVIQEICSKLDQCIENNFSKVSCHRLLPLQDNFDLPLGLRDGLYANAQEMSDAEDAKELSANESATKNCISEIKSLECNSAQVQNAYSTARPENYSTTYQILPAQSGSCISIYEGN